MNSYCVSKKELKELVLNKIELIREVKDDDIFDAIDNVLLMKSKESYISFEEKEVIKRDIFNSIRRLDILQELLDDKQITEIMINGSNKILLKRKEELDLGIRSLNPNKSY